MATSCGTMMNVPLRASVVLVALGGLALAGCGGRASVQQAPNAPPTEHPLLSAPDPAKPTERGAFLNDPKGQVERIAAGGHLIAWSVRTPADTIRESGGEFGQLPPVRMPTSSKLVIVDERGGTPLTVELGRRWVSKLRMIRGGGGPAEPQLAIKTCPTRKESGCRAELLSVTPDAPLKVTARIGGADAAAAVHGYLDTGRRLEVAANQRTSCRPRLTVRDRNGAVLTLPRLPERSGSYPRCRGLVGRFIFGNYAFITVQRENPKLDFTADTVYGIDLTKGSNARWRAVYAPYRVTPGSAGVALGPGVTDRALYWEETDDSTELTYSLNQVALPRDIERDPTRDTPTTSDPIAPDSADACDVAATDSAIYELDNPRCSIFPGHQAAGAIRRIVNPSFHPADG
jgi:hypothetical protein